MLLVVLAAAVMVGVTEAATTDAPPEPAKCCFDKEFTATMGELGGVAVPTSGQAYVIDGYLKIGYDFYRKRVGNVNHVRTPDGSNVTAYTLFDFANRMQYIKKGNASCVSRRIESREMSPPCIPANATFLGSTVFGYGASTLTVNNWEFLAPLTAYGLDGNALMKMGVTRDHCVPVTETIMGTAGGGNPIEITMYYTSYHPGIENVNNLEPPTDCPLESDSNPIGRPSV